MEALPWAGAAALPASGRREAFRTPGATREPLGGLWGFKVLGVQGFRGLGIWDGVGFSGLEVTFLGSGV